MDYAEVWCSLLIRLESGICMYFIVRGRGNTDTDGGRVKNVIILW